MKIPVSRPGDGKRLVANPGAGKPIPVVFFEPAYC
jgi:hypothetical protein